MKTVLGIIGIVLMVVAIASSLHLEWSHPDDTKRRLFLDHTPQIIFNAVMALVGCGLLTYATRTKR